MRNLLFVTLLVGFCHSALAEITIKGQLLDEDNQPIATAQVKSAAVSVLTDDHGNYSLTLPNSDIYQIHFSKDNFYNSLQSFSHFELQVDEHEQADIAKIILVKKAAKRVMFAFGGDVMMGRRYYTPAFGDAVLITDENRLSDSKAIVEHVKPYMSLADFAAVNLETQVSATLPGDRAPKSVTFYSKPEILDALTWAGIDYVTLGNNHTFDYMNSGLKSTLEHLNNSPLGFSGAGVNEQQALTAHHQNINNTEFSMLGYVGWEGSITPTQTAGKDKGGAAFGSINNIIESVSREVANDKVTFVQYHGSQEYSTAPTGVTEQRLKSAIDNGASLAIAHHPHVTQGIELYNGKLIAYSMGNFVFDQYIGSTPYSFILYVWMDGDTFHRAEIVPLYLKGYKPTPATGMHRYNTMKRLVTLSNERGTHIGLSGGHGVISAANLPVANSNTATDIKFTDATRVASLSHLPWQSNISEITLPEAALSYRLGTNLVNGSDFESFSTFNSDERGFSFDRQSAKLNDFGDSGNKSLALTVSQDKLAFIAMKSFRRVYKASSPMTLKANFTTDKAVKVNFYWQGRKSRQGFKDALATGKKHLISSVSLKADKAWQPVEIEFNSPRIGYRSYRVMAEFELIDGSTAQVNIDDFSLIEWQTSYSKQAVPALFNIGSKQASFIGLNQPTDKVVTIKN